MKRVRSYAMMMVAVLMITAAVTAPCHSAYQWTGNGYYRFLYDSPSQFAYVSRVSSYLNESFLSAYKILGNRGWQGRIDVYLYSKNDGFNGYTRLGLNAMWLNTLGWNASTTGALIGRTVAHETSHILFNHHVNGKLWGNKTKAMWDHYQFLSESLAYYTGNVAYAYGPKYSAATIKYWLKTRHKQTGYLITWAGTGYIYNNSSLCGATIRDQAWWQFHAQGWYLTGNNKSGNPQLVKLLDTLRTYSYYSGKYLQSGTYSTARAYFEYSFKVGYGSYANADCSANYWNTSYLYARWHNIWYV